MRFECFRKRGQHWQYLGTYSPGRYAEDKGKSAASACAYVHNLKAVGVRPEDSRDKLFVYRFAYVPLISHAGN